MSEARIKKSWEVVHDGQSFFAENYGPYGYKQVGIKTPECKIIWLAQDTDPEYQQMENYAKEICAHMNLLK